MTIFDHFTEGQLVGPHKKFLMFFTDTLVPWVGGNDVEFGVEFWACTMLCSTHTHMYRILSGRPEVEEFRQKWNKEITPEELDAFINWTLTSSETPRFYEKVFVAVALALAPFYKDDVMAKTYIDNIGKNRGLLKYVVEEILKNEAVT